MSLDVYLNVSTPQVRKVGSGIFIREDGQNKEISVEEWNSRFPDRQVVMAQKAEWEKETTCVFSCNITHNLGRMAEAAGIYQYLWRPDELGITQAFKLIAPLQRGLDTLLANPEHFKTFNPENGWGTYEGLVRFVTEYVKACTDNPDATVSVSR